MNFTMLTCFAVGGVVDVGEVTVTKALELGVQIDLLGEVVVQRQRAHDAHDDALLLGLLGDPLALVEEDLRLGIPVERYVLREYELSHVLLSPLSGSASPHYLASATDQPDVKT